MAQFTEKDMYDMLTSSRTYNYALWNAIKRSSPGVKSYAEDKDKHSQQTTFTACAGIREHAASILHGRRAELYVASKMSVGTIEC